MGLLRVGDPLFWTGGAGVAHLTFNQWVVGSNPTRFSMQDNGMLHTQLNQQLAKKYFETYGFANEIDLLDFIKKSDIGFGDAENILKKFGYVEKSRNVWIKNLSASQ